MEKLSSHLSTEVDPDRLARLVESSMDVAVEVLRRALWLSITEKHEPPSANATSWLRFEDAPEREVRVVLFNAIADHYLKMVVTNSESG